MTIIRTRRTALLSPKWQAWRWTYNPTDGKRYRELVASDSRLLSLLGKLFIWEM